MSVWQGMLRTEMAVDTATYKALLGAVVGAGRGEEARQLLDFAAREGVPLLEAIEADEGGGGLQQKLEALVAQADAGAGVGAKEAEVQEAEAEEAAIDPELERLEAALDREGYSW